MIKQINKLKIKKHTRKIKTNRNKTQNRKTKKNIILSSKSKSHKKYRIIKYKKNGVDVNQKGGNPYGTIKNPKLPNNIENNTISIVLDCTKHCKKEDEFITRQMILETHYIQTYQELFDIIESKLELQQTMLLDIYDSKFIPISKTDDIRKKFTDPDIKFFVISSVKKIRPLEFQELLHSAVLHSHLEYLPFLSSEKPVVTFSSNMDLCGINNASIERKLVLNWRQYNDLEQTQLLEYIMTEIIKKDIDVQIYISSRKRIVFYAIKYFRLLCEIFNYELETGLKIVSDTFNKDEKYSDDAKYSDETMLAFIYIAYGDLTVKKEKDLYDYSTAFTFFEKNKELKHFKDDYNTAKIQTE